MIPINKYKINEPTKIPVKLRIKPIIENIVLKKATKQYGIINCVIAFLSVLICLICKFSFVPLLKVNDFIVLAHTYLINVVLIFILINIYLACSALSISLRFSLSISVNILSSIVGQS